jgi:hypothetical protein
VVGLEDVRKPLAHLDNPAMGSDDGDGLEELGCSCIIRLEEMLDTDLAKVFPPPDACS